MLATLARIDSSPRHRQPSTMRVLVATCVALAAALLADALLVAIGTHVFPATIGYEHFRFDDYAKLTTIGVVIGCAGWPIVTRVTSAPRWLYGRLTVLFTVALFLPDAWLLMRGQPLKGVAVLMAMHVAVALAIYLAIVTIAPVRGDAHRSGIPHTHPDGASNVRATAGVGRATDVPPGGIEPPSTG